MKEQKITILVNKQPFHVNITLISACEIRGLVAASDDYEVWMVVKSPDPEGQLPNDDIQISGDIEVKSGDRFRVVPPGTFGLEQKVGIQLRSELEQLKEEGIKVELSNCTNLFYLIIHDYILPLGYNNKKTKLLIKIPFSYPNGNLDMFWTDIGLSLKGGGKPESTSEENIVNQKWLRFSWHPQKWNPAIDNIMTFLEFIDRRLSQVK